MDGRDERDETATRVRTAFERVVRLVPGDPVLHPPATDAQLDAAEAHLGQRLPADVRAVHQLVGVDLDPDVRGTVGQVVTFGRDDEPWSLRVPPRTSPHSSFRAEG